MKKLVAAALTGALSEPQPYVQRMTRRLPLQHPLPRMQRFWSRQNRFWRSRDMNWRLRYSTTMCSQTK